MSDTLRLQKILKALEDNAFKTLEAFDVRDLRGLSAVRNFIAHDYDSVDDEIIESVIRDNLPCIKTSVIKLLNE